MIKRILVPTDGTERANEACNMAISLAKENGATIKILSVVDQSEIRNISRIVEAVGPVRQMIEDDYRKAAIEASERLQKKCILAGVNAETVIREGQSAEEIVNEAKESQTDLIVMGQPKGSWKLLSVLFQKIGRSLIERRSGVPVLIIP